MGTRSHYLELFTNLKTNQLFYPMAHFTFKMFLWACFVFVFVFLSWSKTFARNYPRVFHAQSFYISAVTLDLTDTDGTVYQVFDNRSRSSADIKYHRTQVATFRMAAACINNEHYHLYAVWGVAGQVSSSTG